jgi:DcaP outer membrane protein
MSWSKASWIGVVLALASGPSNALGQAAEAPAQADPQVQALRDQVRTLEAQLQRTEELSLQSRDRLQALEQERSLRASAAVASVGDFPGSLRIPGTDAALKIGGQVRVVLVDSFAAIGSSDRFVTSSIPLRGTATAAEGPGLTMTVAPSRFNLDVRSPSSVGDLRAFFETDFAGANGTPRLRHGFAQWGKLLVGQTWSTFSDPEAEPDSIDFEGLNAISLVRQVQVRYTQPLARKVTLAASLEDPKPEVTDAIGVNKVPDLVLRLRWDAGQPLDPSARRAGHLQAAVVLRQVRGVPESMPTRSAFTPAYGVGASGRFNTGWVFAGDDLTFAAYAGKGIGRYLTDLDTFGGQDAIYDPATGNLELMPVVAGYLGYELGWTKALRSALTLGWVQISNLDIQAPGSFKKSVRGSANLVWSPVSQLEFVGEFLIGKRWTKDGEWGEATQLQVGARYGF